MQSDKTKEINLPASPIPVHGEIRDAASNVIGAEQWLQTHGWREPLRLMTLAKGDQFLDGYRQFIGRLALEHARVKRGALLFWLPVSALSGLVGLWLGWLGCAFFN